MKPLMPRAASVLTNSIAMPLLFIGGSFFPFETMPAWMARIGRWTPNGWALGHLKDILDGRENAMILGLAFATMITLVLVPVLYAIFVVDLRIVRWPGAAVAARPAPGAVALSEVA